MNRGAANLLSVLAAVGMAVVCASASEPADALRFYGAQQDTFEYVFASTVTHNDGKVALAFNRANGRTVFARLGESLGGYLLTHYEVATNRVFNASVNAWQTSRTGIVTLRGPDGQTFQMEQGKPCALPGWRAQIMRPDTGDAWTAREGESFVFDGVEVGVASVSPTSVVARTVSSEFVVRRASSEDRERFRRVREDFLRREAEAAASGRVDPTAAPAPFAHAPPAGPDIPSASFGGSFGGSRSVEMRMGYGVNPYEYYPPQLYTFGDDGKPVVIPLRPGYFDLTGRRSAGVAGPVSRSGSMDGSSSGSLRAGSAAGPRKPFYHPAVSSAPHR